VTWSDALFRIYGEEPGAFVPSMDAVLAYIHEEDKAAVSQTIDDAAASASEFEVDYRITRPDGQVRTIICKGQPEFDTNGEMIGMFGVGTDVTEAYDAIRSIHDQKEMLDLAARIARLGHWVWSTGELRISYFSDELASIYDMTPEIFAARIKQPADIFESVDPKNRQRYAAVVTQALETGTAYEVECGITTIKGVKKDIREIGQPIFGPNGKLARFVVTVQDTTEAKRSEHELREAKTVLETVASALKDSERKLRDVIENSIQGIVVLRDFCPVFANQAYADILGAAHPDDVIQLGDMRGYIDPAGLSCAAELWDEVMQGPEGAAVRRSNMMPTLDGRSIWTDTVGRRIEWEGGPAFLMTVIDVTERHLAEENLKNKSLELQELNQQKDKLFSVIAHDLRSPFNTIIGFSELLTANAQELEPQRVSEYAGLVHASAVGVHDLLDNLLAWATVQMRGATLKMSVLDLAEVSRASVEPLFHMAREKDIRIENLSESISVLGDESLVRIVLRNLISNGIKFSHPGGVVRIEGVPAGDAMPSMVNVRVQDFGVGMSTENTESLFSLDRAVSKVGTKGENGTGLGLYLCRDIVKRHGGAISISSEPGGGTCVTFSLPCAKAYFQASNHLFPKAPKPFDWKCPDAPSTPCISGSQRVRLLALDR